MIGTGTIVNTAVIIAGGALGLLIKKGIPQRMKDTIMQGIGLAVLMVGLSGALQGLYKVIAGGKLDRQYIMLMIFSLVIGGVSGELINIEDRLEKLGDWLKNKFSKGSGNFTQGFVTASLIYCIGAMAIVGSLEDGLTGNANTLFAKSILDGVSSVIFSASLGVGVLFSSLPVFIYQGAITLAAGVIKPFLTDVTISQMSLVGSVLIFGIGINILGIKKINVANLLPAIFVPFAYYLITLIH